MRRPDLGRIAAIAATIAGISALHYATSPTHAVLHAVYQRLYYAPIIVAAYWYGLPGGVAAALASGIVYLPHIETAWADNPAHAASQYAEIVVFAAIGFAVGLITSHERRLVDEARRSATSLERANRELRESQEHLRRAERLSALGEISAGLAHEIRNPLAGIRGALEIIADRAAPDTPEAEFSAIVSREVDRLDALLSEFLSYARPRPPEKRDTDLDALILRVALLLQPEADRAGVSVDVLAADRPGARLLMDSQQIEQVLFNLALNAIQASPRGGRVTIARQAGANGAVIDVTDRGPGIPPDRLAHVFEPFFTTKERGTGLGLAISQRIARAHGGDIELRPAPGGGTEARFELPRLAPPAAAATGMPR